MSDGPTLFGDYIVQTGKKKADVAEELDTSISAVHYWIKGGQKPRSEMRDKIEKWSHGAVPAGSWKDAEDIAALEELVPASERTPTEGKGKAS